MTSEPETAAVSSTAPPVVAVHSGEQTFGLPLQFVTPAGSKA